MNKNCLKQKFEIMALVFVEGGMVTRIKNHKYEARRLKEELDPEA